MDNLRFVIFEMVTLISEERLEEVRNLLGVLKIKEMKVQQKYKQNAREASIIAQAAAFKRVAKHLENLAKNPKAAQQLELVWFFKDKDDKIIKTGGSNMMAFRRNQIWRQFITSTMRAKSDEITVHLIDMISGIQATRTLSQALEIEKGNFTRYDTKQDSIRKFREDMINEIIGLKI